MAFLFCGKVNRRTEDYENHIESCCAAENAFKSFLGDSNHPVCKKIDRRFFIPLREFAIL